MISSSLNADITATTRNELFLEECPTRLNEPVSLADFPRHGLERRRAAPERWFRDAVTLFSSLLLESRSSCIVLFGRILFGMGLQSASLIFQSQNRFSPIALKNRSLLFPHRFDNGKRIRVSNAVIR